MAALLPLHIIEPTLTGDAGHCLSLVRALGDAALQTGRCDLTVWGGQGAGAAWAGPGRLQAHFHRRWRKLQAWLLYRRLLQQPGRILVATAGTTDLLSAGWAARGPLPPNKFYAFVHWLNLKPGKAARLQRLAQRQPNLQILAPTAAVADFFRQCGFSTTQVPYPLEAAVAPAEAVGAGPITHLLVPGGARMDKGFGHIVALVEAMQQRGLTLPITVQTAIEPRHAHDTTLAAALARLRACPYPGLTLIEQAPDAAQYRALFSGALVLQPYDAVDFKDRVSGVTLDALAAGAPVVVTAGTWMARLVQPLQAGVAVDDLSPEGLLQAIHTVMADAAGHAHRARGAGAQVAAAHSARGLIDVVLDDALPNPRADH